MTTRSSEKPLLAEGPIGKLLFTLTIPMIMGLAGIVTFNLVDTFFVGQLGATELAALSFTFPVVMVIGSLALGLGSGASAVISRAIGEADSRKVRRLTTDSLILSLLLVGTCVLIGFLTIEGLFKALGATAELLPLIKQYMIIWYPGMIFVVVPMVGNNAIRATGDTKTPGLIMLLAAIVNAILDPLLIFGLGPFPRLELAGAAIATVIARAITLVVALWVLGRRDKMLTAKVESLRAVFESWKSILYIGIPTAGTRIIIPFSIGVITRLLASYGPEAVAGFGVAMRIEFFAMVVVLALATVVGPFVGQNLGAGRFDRVRTCLRYSKWFSFGWGAGMLFIFLFSAKWIAHLFNDNPKVVSTIVLYLMIVPACYGLQGILQLSATALNVLKKPLHAAALMVLQMFVFYIPLAYAGSRFLGMRGIFGGIVIAYFLGGTASHIVLGKVLTTEEQNSTVHPEN